jgi:hypothetical protein
VRGLISAWLTFGVSAVCLSSVAQAQEEPDPGAGALTATVAETADTDTGPRRVPLGDVSEFSPQVDTARRPAGVMDTLDLGATSITGTQELPRVLYIVPWKRSELGTLNGRPANTLLEEVLAPVDPAVFERHLKYHQALHGQSE